MKNLARAALSKTTETSVLIRSRRRCCICFAINRDFDLKSGQIAHIDRDNTNNREENLAFLCLNHHDEYDSRSSQRKNFTAHEILSYRHELYDHVEKALNIPVHFGSLALPATDPYAGTYVRTGTGSDSAEVNLTPIPDGTEQRPRYYISGFAVWGAHRDYGPNMGELGIAGQVDDAGIIEGCEYSENGSYRIRLRFKNGQMELHEENSRGRYGMNVTFIGIYNKS
ncbi:hypothetical protein [Falsiroseomonas sp.]|uniref:hypothetical protein n=1 Tax=Falsiroseomonas sp. TaxID=2870721 RepID=UPI0027363B17|nr:hypothetical protein [Falsiroseomonas sp.]